MRMPSLRTACLALAPALVLVPTHARGQASDTAASHRQAAEHLLVVAGTEKMLDVMRTQSVDAMLAQSPQLKPVANTLRQFYQEQLDWKVLEPEYVTLYVDVFSEQELRDIAAFYETPIGQKMLSRMPELMLKSQQLASARIQAAMPRLIARLQQDLEAQRAAAPGDSAAARPPAKKPPGA